MPYQTWTHTCTKTGKSSTRFALFRCWRCWRLAEYDGWRRGVHEGMYERQRAQGLKPIGPHWAFANRVFSNVFKPCPNCEGKGVLDGDAPGTYAYCGPCDGRGLVAAVSDDEIERRRAVVLEWFPEAACDHERLPVRTSVEGPRAVCGESSTPVVDTVLSTPRRRVDSTEKPDVGTLIFAVISTLFLAPGWLFAAIEAFRKGLLLIGSVLLFASAFAALCGLMTASPWSFNRKWTGVWGVLGAGFFLLLAIVTGQSACASWAEAGSRPVNGASIERSIQ